MNNNKAQFKLEDKDWYKDMFESEIYIEMLLFIFALRFDFRKRNVYFSVYFYTSFEEHLNWFTPSKTNQIDFTLLLLSSIWFALNIFLDVKRLEFIRLLERWKLSDI